MQRGWLTDRGRPSPRILKRWCGVAIPANLHGVGPFQLRREQVRRNRKAIPLARNGGVKCKERGGTRVEMLGVRSRRCAHMNPVPHTGTTTRVPLQRDCVCCRLFRGRHCQHAYCRQQRTLRAQCSKSHHVCFYGRERRESARSRRAKLHESRRFLPQPQYVRDFCLIEHESRARRSARTAFRV